MKLSKGYESDSSLNCFSEIFAESDWPVTFVVRTMFTEYWSSEWAKESGRYHVEIHAVSPEACGPENVAKALSCDNLEDASAIERVSLCEALLEYGISAILWQKTGNNRKKLEKEARDELGTIAILFGFYMDRPMNAIGNSGWDFIKGEIGFKVK